MVEIRIDIEMDRVLVEGVSVARPLRVSRSDWVAFWERAAYERIDDYSNVGWC